MRPIASDLTPGGPEATVDWMRISPYPGSGTFDSPVFDAGASQTADWGALELELSDTLGAAVALSARAGSTPTPDGSWSSFTPIAASSGGDIPGHLALHPVPRDLSSGSTAKTPELSQSRSDARRARTPPRRRRSPERTPAPNATDVPRDTNVTAQFSEAMNPATIEMRQSVHLRERWDRRAGGR